MPSLQDIRKAAQAKTPAETTSSGDRIELVEVSTDDMSELVLLKSQGSQLKKEGEAILKRASRLYLKVKDALFSNRSPERPKMYKYVATDQLGEEHIASIIVKENGHRAISDDVLEKVRALVGDEFVDKYFTTRITGKVDFSLIPEALHDKAAEYLMGLNELVGQEVAEFGFESKPTSEFHPARASLSEEDDRALEKLVPTPVAFGR